MRRCPPHTPKTTPSSPGPPSTGRRWLCCTSGPLCRARRRTGVGEDRRPQREITMVKSWARTGLLRDDPEGIARFLSMHREASPEALAGLRGVGLLSMKVFVHDLRLFVYMETVDACDPRTDFLRDLEESEEPREWSAALEDLLQPTHASTGRESWSWCDEIFCFQAACQRGLGRDGPLDAGVTSETRFGETEYRAVPGKLVEPGRSAEIGDVAVAASLARRARRTYQRVADFACGEETRWSAAVILGMGVVSGLILGIALAPTRRRVASRLPGAF